MLKEGMQITIGGKYAESHFYDKVVGCSATILSVNSNSAYDSVYVQVCGSPRRHFFIYKEDALLIDGSNEDYLHLLNP